MTFSVSYKKSVEELFIARGISFKLITHDTYLLNGKYYVTLAGSWRKKGTYTWYPYGGYRKVESLLDRLFEEVEDATPS